MRTFFIPSCSYSTQSYMNNTIDVIIQRVMTAQAVILTNSHQLLACENAIQQSEHIRRIAGAAADTEVFMLGLQQKIDSLKTILSVTECNSDDMLKILNYFA